MHVPMNELALSKDRRCEARRIRLVDRDDLHFRQVSRSRVAEQTGVQEPIGVSLNSNNFSKKCIALADCDEFLSTGLCFYDEGEAACFSPSWFVILKPMDIERWKCAAPLLKETLSSGTWTNYDGLLERYEPDWQPLYKREADLGIAACIFFVGVECMYGGLHALAWMSDFRTIHERNLWRFAVVFIVAFGPVAIVFFVISKTFSNDEESELDAMQAPAPHSMQTSTRKSGYIFYGRNCFFHQSMFALCGNVCGVIVLFICSINVSARIFLVVDCLIALFNSVPGVFEEPSWSTYFPHIT